MSDVGLYGLAVMGQNFALNMASKGFTVSLFLSYSIYHTAQWIARKQLNRTAVCTVWC
jgi:6-phosphogluconate dehydrogenase